MLVRVWKDFVLKGYTNKEKGVFKKKLVKEDIYVSTGITPIICDESEVKEKLAEAIEKKIKEKQDNLVGNMASQGTTPRQITDLIGSLCDLTSGSGDKGTPVVLVQGYFDNYTNE